MTISTKDQQELDQIFCDYKSKYEGKKEDYFALLYMKKKFGRDVEALANQVAFGGNDYGIDAYHLDRESRNLYLFQFKWSENHNLFKESLERLTQAGMERIFGNPLQDPDQNEYLRYLKEDLHEHQSLIDRVYIQFVFKGDLETAERSTGLSDRIEGLQNKKYLLEVTFVNRQVELCVEFISDVRKSAPPPKTDTFPMNFVQNDIHMLADKKAMYVGFVSLMDLYRIYREIGKNFLERNIRAGLSPDNPPNRKIREALSDIVLKKKEHPGVFAFNHNGVTLAVEQLIFDPNQTVIKVPRLLNGAQTVSSVAKFIEENESSPDFKNGQTLLDEIRVLAKVIVCDVHSDFITDVTVNNNRQNPVDPWNLRANDLIQCDLQDKFAEELRIYYSRQENAFNNYSDSELEEMGIEDARDIKIKPLAQTFCAIQGEIDRMSRLAEVFENKKYYEETFRKSYLKCDLRKLILVYKVHLVLNSAMIRLEEMCSEKLAYPIGRGRNLVWSLLIQGLLNSSELSHYAEIYGTSLTKEDKFRDLMRDIASTKILPILRKVFQYEGYQKKIKDEKYSFLRTNSVFKFCMDVAYEKYKWKKQSI